MEEYDETANIDRDVEKYFRPSNMPVLNNRFTWRFFDDYYGKNVSEIRIPDHLLDTPENTILNYFSILREAANSQEGYEAGCGSIGSGRAPYPVVYNFLSPSYQRKLSYEEYLNTFLNILHMNLVKYSIVPLYDNPNHIVRYFVEYETIEGSMQHTAVFAYYYGFIDLIKENGQYRITSIEINRENYLCAPYHGWSYDAEALVQVRYGDWCSLIKKITSVTQNGYIKSITFMGTDGNEYLILFFQLTNDTDIEIAQYMKNINGSWMLIKINPEECLKNKVDN